MMVVVVVVVVAVVAVVRRSDARSGQQLILETSKSHDRSTQGGSSQPMA